MKWDYFYIEFKCRQHRTLFSLRLIFSWSSSSSRTLSLSLVFVFVLVLVLFHHVSRLGYSCPCPCCCRRRRRPHPNSSSFSFLPLSFFFSLFSFFLKSEIQTFRLRKYKQKGRNMINMLQNVLIKKEVIERPCRKESKINRNGPK
jgi:hypothetical protein